MVNYVNVQWVWNFAWRILETQRSPLIAEYMLLLCTVGRTYYYFCDPTSCLEDTDTFKIAFFLVYICTN